MNGRLSEEIKALYRPHIGLYQWEALLTLPGQQSPVLYPTYDDGELERFASQPQQAQASLLDKHFSEVMLFNAVDKTPIEKYQRFFRPHVDIAQHELIAARFQKHNFTLPRTGIYVR
jgi:hypothetical protein